MALQRGFSACFWASLQDLGHNSAIVAPIAAKKGPNCNVLKSNGIDYKHTLIVVVPEGPLMCIRSFLSAKRGEIDPTIAQILPLGLRIALKWP